MKSELLHVFFFEVVDSLGNVTCFGVDKTVPSSFDRSVETGFVS